MASLVIGGKENVSFATFNLPGTSNEDRACSILTHTNADNNDNISSFGIFDGHNGSLAATLCAKKFHISTVETFMSYKLFCEEHMNNLDDYDKFIDLLNEEDKLDSILCHSINETIDNLNISIQMESTAGSTVCSLFLRNVYEQTSTDNLKKENVLIQTRAYCANIGDSRCVMVTALPCSPEQHPRNSISEFFKRKHSSSDSLNDSCHSVPSDHSSFAKVFIDVFEQSNNLSSDNSNNNNDLTTSLKIRSSSIDTLEEQGLNELSVRNDDDSYINNIEITENIKSETNKVISENNSNRTSTNNNSLFSSLKHTSLQSFMHSESISIPGVHEHVLPVYVTVNLIQASEDHSVKCSRERRRISYQIPIEPLSLPIPMVWNDVSINNKAFNYSNQLKNEDLVNIVSTICSERFLFPNMSSELQRSYANKESNVLATQEKILKADKDLDTTNRGYGKDDSKLEYIDIFDGIDTQITTRSTTTTNNNNNNATATIANGNAINKDEMIPISDAIDHYSYHSSPSLLKQIRKSSLVKKTFASTNLLKLLVEAASNDDKSESNLYITNSSSIFENNQNKETIVDDIGPQLVFDEESSLLPLRYYNDVATNPIVTCTNSTSNAQQLYVLKLFAAYQYIKIVTESYGLPIQGIPGQRIPSPNLTRTASFIDNRYSRDGKTKGPEAFYGRYNHSLLMTRSFGDRLGPRGCISLPDISIITIPSTKHVRFVIASDGVWEVVTSDTVRQWSLYYKYKAPQDLAVYIAFKARRRRLKQQLRMDDITVSVIDINPQHAMYIKTDACSLEPTIVKKINPDFISSKSSPSKSSSTSNSPPVSGISISSNLKQSNSYQDTFLNNNNNNEHGGIKTKNCKLKILGNICNPTRIGIENDSNRNIFVNSVGKKSELDDNITSSNAKEFIYQYDLNDQKSCSLM